MTSTKRIFVVLIAIASVFRAQDGFKTAVSEINVAFSEREFGQLEDRLGFRVFLGVGAAYSGYYGATQTIKLLSDFTVDLKRYSFKKSISSKEKNLGYISGEIFYLKNGRHLKYNVFISLKKNNGIWQITQITIN
jgi:hypothetical protein